MLAMIFHLEELEALDAVHREGEGSTHPRCSKRLMMGPTRPRWINCQLERTEHQFPMVAIAIPGHHRA